MTLSSPLLRGLIVGLSLLASHYLVNFGCKMDFCSDIAILKANISVYETLNRLTDAEDCQGYFMVIFHVSSVLEIVAIVT